MHGTPNPVIGGAVSPGPPAPPPQLVPAHPGSPGQRAVKRACVCYFQ